MVKFSPVCLPIKVARLWDYVSRYYSPVNPVNTSTLMSTLMRYLFPDFCRHQWVYNWNPCMSEWSNMCEYSGILYLYMWWWMD